MYPYVLIAHNTWRWVVLGLGLLLLIAVVRGLREQTPWGTGVALKARLFAIAVDLQLLGGAALYLGLNPLTTAERSNAGSLQAGSAGYGALWPGLADHHRRHAVVAAVAAPLITGRLTGGQTRSISMAMP